MNAYLPYLTALGAVIAFLFSVYQYVGTMRVSEKNKRFEQFHRVFEWVGGRSVEGGPLVDTQQAMAVYELSEFPEYKDISLPIIEYYIDNTEGEPDGSLLRRALIVTKARLDASNEP